MFKKLFALAAVFALVALPVLAEDDHAGHSHGEMTKEAMMAAMAQEMAGCQVCSVMLPHMQTTCATMTMEIVTLNDGMAVMHSVADDAVAEYHALGDKMHQAGDKVMSMDDKAAADALCGHCEQWRGLMVAGAKFHRGNTESGDIMVFTSDDAKVQKMIAGVEAEWRTMMKQMEG